VPFQGDLDPRTFPLDDRSSERLDQRLNVGKYDRSEGRTCEDRLKRFPVLEVHEAMLSQSAITGKADI
jgi:hypothetical protein